MILKFIPAGHLVESQAQEPNVFSHKRGGGLTLNSFVSTPVCPRSLLLPWYYEWPGRLGLVCNV